MRKNLEGCGRDRLIYRNLSGVTEDNYGSPLLGYPLPVARSRIVELYLHTSMYLHGVALN
jgi:hypothetical protein